MAFSILKGQDPGNHKLFPAPTVQPEISLDEQKFINYIVQESSGVEKTRACLKNMPSSFLIIGRRL